MDYVFRLLDYPLFLLLMTEKTFYLSFYDELTFQSTKSFMDLCSEILIQSDPEELYFLFSSPGGSVDAGITLFNYLKALPPKITMHNTGSIDSIANVVFLAGDSRYAAPHSSFHFHGVSFSWSDPQNLSQMKEKISNVEQCQNRISGIICENTTITPQEMHDLFLQGERKDLSFALSRGIITELREPAIPSGFPFLTINSNPK